MISQSARKRTQKSSQKTLGVYLRLRPSHASEPAVVKMDEQQVMTIPPDGSDSQIYKFTKVFDNVTQSEIFDEVAKPVVKEFIVNAKNGLIFTYGITGSGKTYTMEGLKADPGLIYRTMDYLFNSIGGQQTVKGLIANDGRNNYRIQKDGHLYPNLHRQEMQSAIPSVIKLLQNRTKEQAFVSVDSENYYCVFISLIELYNKQVIDLLEDMNSDGRCDRKKLAIHSDPNNKNMSYVANAVEIEVKSADEAVEIYTRGIKRRKTKATALNLESSRGHCVLKLKLVRCSKSARGDFDKDTLAASQLCLVDLAGSERAKRSGATGGALHEACNINNSLGALRKCIKALQGREKTSTTFQYREYSLTRLFQSYLEGNGIVRMVLCVKPTSDDFYENNIVMEFGELTQHVTVDYASPPKKSRSSSIQTDDQWYPMICKYLNMKLSHNKPDPDISDEQFIDDWILRAKSNRDKRKECVKNLRYMQDKIRYNIVKTDKENEALKGHFGVIAESLKNREAGFRKYVCPTPPRTRQSHYKKQQQQHELDTPNNSTPTTTPEQSHTPPTTSNSSIEYQEQAPTAPAKTLVTSPSQIHGVPVVNLRHNRSLSCSSLQWIHYKPPGTLNTGTVFKPKFKHGTTVKKLRSSDILKKDAGGYSLVHQDADTNGDVETSIYKGHILPTVCGGAQVILDDIETMKQASPKRKRSSSDAH